MRNLLGFIKKHHFFLLFLLLGTAAMLFTMSRQYYQQTFLLHSASRISGLVYNTCNSVTGYLSLKPENKELLRENVRLRAMHKENFIITDRYVFTMNDSLYQRRFTYMNAQIINNSVNRRNNYLTLNKGRLHGIEPDMGVITRNGVAGIIINVSNHFSVAMSLLHSEMALSVKFSKNDHIGSLHWGGTDYRTAHMSYIPTHVELEVGDTIVTSGYSLIFPENILIGTIKDWDIRRGETFYTASIDLVMDANTIRHVYVVENLLGDEQEALELSTISN